MNLCLDCRFCQRGHAFEDNICTRTKRMIARERFSAAGDACGLLGRFWLPAEDRAIGRREWGESI